LVIIRFHHILLLTETAKFFRDMFSGLALPALGPRHDLLAATPQFLNLLFHH
jgi:hypothetical protein